MLQLQPLKQRMKRTGLKAFGKRLRTAEQVKRILLISRRSGKTPIRKPENLKRKPKKLQMLLQKPKKI
jgi:hypothetical protein